MERSQRKKSYQQVTLVTPKSAVKFFVSNCCPAQVGGRSSFIIGAVDIRLLLRLAADSPGLIAPAISDITPSILWSAIVRCLLRQWAEVNPLDLLLQKSDKFVAVLVMSCWPLPVLALSRHGGGVERCPLLEAKQKTSAPSEYFAF
jgi:hypothetical protein